MPDPIPFELLQGPVHGEPRLDRGLPRGGPITAPGISPRVRDQSGPDRFQDDVPAELQQMCLLLDHDGLKPPLEQVPHTPMAAIKGLRVDAIELPDGEGQIGRRRFEQQMIMVGHQDLGVADDTVLLDHLRERINKPGTIAGIADEGFALIAPRRDVIYAARKVESQGTGHGPGGYAPAR